MSHLYKASLNVDTESKKKKAAKDENMAFFTKQTSVVGNKTYLTHSNMQYSYIHDDDKSVLLQIGTKKEQNKNVNFSEIFQQYISPTRVAISRYRTELMGFTIQRHVIST